MTSPRPARRSFLAGALAALVAACSPSRRASTAPPGSSTPPPAPSTAPASTTASTSSSGPARFVPHGDRGRTQVALTFHTNGDRALVERLLEVVEARHVVVTAFIVGAWLDQNPDFAARLQHGGHELANHTYNHLTFANLDEATKTAEVTRCRDVLARLSGSGGAYFRPSGTANGVDVPGADVLRVAADAGYAIVAGYDVDPADYADPGSTAVVQRTLGAVQPGSIVSLHFGHQGTIDALPAIIDGVRARHLEPVTMTALLS